MIYCNRGCDNRMTMLANYITSFLVRYRLVEPRENEWCAYLIESRLTQMITIPFLILVGSVIAPLDRVIILNLGMIFLRPKTNGYHAKTFAGCMLFSMALELVALACLAYMNSDIAWIALGIAVATVLAFGPDNNLQVHYSEEEYRKLRKKMYTALLAYFLLCSILIYLLPKWAYSLIMALLADAFLLILARVVRCIQRRFVP